MVESVVEFGNGKSSSVLHVHACAGCIMLGLRGSASCFPICAPLIRVWISTFCLGGAEAGCDVGSVERHVAIDGGEFEFTFVCVFHVLSCPSTLFLLFLLLSPALFVCCDFPSLLHCRAIACPGLSASCSIYLNTDSRTLAAPNHDKHSSWLDSVDTALEGSAPGNVALKATHVACLVTVNSMFTPN